MWEFVCTLILYCVLQLTLTHVSDLQRVYILRKKDNKAITWYDRILSQRENYNSVKGETDPWFVDFYNLSTT